MSKNDFTKLTLKNVKVEFWNKGNEKFKPSIVISADDPAVKKKITQWVEDNRVGEGKLAGKAIFGKYTPDGEDGKTYYRYTFRVTDRTKIQGINGLGVSDIGRGSRVSLMANAFGYKTQFGSGVSKSVTAIKVLTPADDSNDKDMGVLMGDTDDEDIELDDFDELEDVADEIKPEDIPEF
ncbi:hypothetical protein IKF43_01790 [Candidatus Saccharibacteria bacterium]|nr:hypothetical protein [Candidatus Saccharibacteria bacterium]